MPKTRTKPTTQPVEAKASIHMSVELNRLIKSAQNVRTDSGDVSELAASIKRHGLLTSLVVVAGQNGYEVIAGSRRLSALRQLAEQGEIPATWPVPVLLVSDDPSPKSLAENLDRAELAPWDEAAAYEQMVMGGMTLEDVAAKIGRSSQYVRRRLALCNLGENIALLKAGAINLAQAVALAELPPHQQRMFLAASAGHNDAAAWLQMEFQFRPQGVGRYLAERAFQVKNALFDVSVYTWPQRDAHGIKGHIIQPLLDEHAGIEPYFSDKAEAIELQRRAVEARAAELEPYWASVLYVATEGAAWRWDYQKLGWSVDWGVKHDQGQPEKRYGKRHLAIVLSLDNGEVVYHGGLYRANVHDTAETDDTDNTAPPAPEKPITQKAWLEAQTARVEAIQAAYARGDLRDVLVVVAALLSGGANLTANQGKFTIHPEIKDSLEAWATRLGLPPNGNPRNAPRVEYNNSMAATGDLISNVSKLSEEELLQFVAQMAAACIGSKNIEYLELGKTATDIDALAARVDIEPTATRSRIDRSWLGGLSFSRLGEIIAEMIGQEPSDLATKKERVAFVLEHLPNYPAYVPGELRPAPLEVVNDT